MIIIHNISNPNPLSSWQATIHRSHMFVCEFVKEIIIIGIATQTWSVFNADLTQGCLCFTSAYNTIT